MKRILLLVLAILLFTTAGCSPADVAVVPSDTESKLAISDVETSVNANNSTEDATGNTIFTDDHKHEQDTDAPSDSDNGSTRHEQSEESIPPETTAPSTEKPSELPVLPAAASLEKMTFSARGNIALNYWLYTPANATEKMPLIVYLHGGSGKGDDLELVVGNGFPQFLNEGTLGDIPAYIIMPQVPSAHKGWVELTNPIKELIEFMHDTYRTNSEKVGLTGHSMGGTGTYSLAAAFPSLFFRVAPLSGSIKNTEANLSALSQMDVWSFVGSEDKIVTPDSSIEFVTALQKRNPNARNTVLEGADHFEVPSLVYLSEEYGLIDWLIE